MTYLDKKQYLYLCEKYTSQITGILTNSDCICYLYMCFASFPFKKTPKKTPLLHFGNIFIGDWQKCKLFVLSFYTAASLTSTKFPADSDPIIPVSITAINNRKKVNLIFAIKLLSA